MSFLQGSHNIPYTIRSLVNGIYHGQQRNYVGNRKSSERGTICVYERLMISSLPKQFAIVSVTEMDRENSRRKCALPLKLFIRDILRLHRSKTDRDQYIFFDKLIQTVDIMGVVSEVKTITENKILYKVQDSTGLINCVCNYAAHRYGSVSMELNALERAVQTISAKQPVVAQACYTTLMSAKVIVLENVTPLVVGDLAHIQGFLRDFHGSKEIVVFELIKIPDINHEIDWMYEMAAIYKKVYEPMWMKHTRKLTQILSHVRNIMETTGALERHKEMPCIVKEIVYTLLFNRVYTDFYRDTKIINLREV